MPQFIMSEEFDFREFKARALEALKAGTPLTGKNGVLAPLLENLLNAAFEGEMDAHTNLGERQNGNRRNGYGSKQVQSSMGELTVQTPRSICSSSKSVSVPLPTASRSALSACTPLAQALVRSAS